MNHEDPLEDDAEEIEAYLKSAGINTHLLFPGLDGLARYLHEKHSIFQSPNVSIYGR